MRFTKMHGAGNDYVYVDGFVESVDDPASLAPRLSDRHFGVGSDGLIVILPPDGPDADVRMRMFNADGSEAEMCGNGIRCVAKYAHDHDLTAARPMRVQTAAGVLNIDYTLDHAGKLAAATVDMGPPILDAPHIPVRLSDVDRVINHSIKGLFDWPSPVGSAWCDQAGLDPRMTCVSMGNPHAVFYVKNLPAVPLNLVGPVIENHPLFPRRVNVHFVHVHRPTEATVVHWERGSGVTLACGTGACAVAVAGALTGRTERVITTHLPGGDLQLQWRPTDDHVLMTGPATEVFTGDWPEQAADPP